MLYCFVINCNVLLSIVVACFIHFVLYKYEWRNLLFITDKIKVGPVTWSDELAKGAKSWADYLAENKTFEHAPNLRVGENLFLSGKPAPKELCTVATKLFYGEVKNYDFNKPGFSGKTGHFTQVKLLL